MRSYTAVTHLALKGSCAVVLGNLIPHDGLWQAAREMILMWASEYLKDAYSRATSLWANLSERSGLPEDITEHARRFYVVGEDLGTVPRQLRGIWVGEKAAAEEVINKLNKKYCKVPPHQLPWEAKQGMLYRVRRGSQLTFYQLLQVIDDVFKDVGKELLDSVVVPLAANTLPVPPLVVLSVPSDPVSSAGRGQAPPRTGLVEARDRSSSVAGVEESADRRDPISAPRGQADAGQPLMDSAAPSAASQKPADPSGQTSARNAHEDVGGTAAVTGTRSDVTYTVGAVLEMCRVSDTTLNKYAKMAEVQTPQRGKRNHRYTAEDVISILDTIVANTSNSEMRKHCREELGKLKHQIQIPRKSTNQT